MANSKSWIISIWFNLFSVLLILQGTVVESSIKDRQDVILAAGEGPFLTILGLATVGIMGGLTGFSKAAQERQTLLNRLKDMNRRLDAAAPLLSRTYNVEKGVEAICSSLNAVGSLNFVDATEAVGFANSGNNKPSTFSNEKNVDALKKLKIVFDRMLDSFGAQDSNCKVLIE